MKLFNGEPENRYFDKTTGINPDIRLYKENNIRALRIMYEISVVDGNIDAPSFNQPSKALLAEDEFGYTEAENSKSLAKKLNQFVKVWPDIKKDARLRAKVSGMLASFHTSWPEYVKAMKVYSDNEQYPVFMDVNDYLTSIIDDNGKLKKDALKISNDYFSLASDWRAEINAEHEAYLERKNENQ